MQLLYQAGLTTKKKTTKKTDTIDIGSVSFPGDSRVHSVRLPAYTVTVS